MGQGNQLEGKHQEEGSRQGEGSRQEEDTLLVGILLGEGSLKVGSHQGEGSPKVGSLLPVGIPVVDNHVEGMVVRLQGNVHQHSQQDLKTVPCL